MAAWHMPQRAVFLFPGRSDDGALAIALHIAGTAQQARQPFGHVAAQRPEVFHEALHILDIAAGKGVLDDGKDRGTAIGRVGDSPPSCQISSTEVTILQILTSGIQLISAASDGK